MKKRVTIGTEGVLGSLICYPRAALLFKTCQSDQKQLHPKTLLESGHRLFSKWATSSRYSRKQSASGHKSRQNNQPLLIYHLKNKYQIHCDMQNVWIGEINNLVRHILRGIRGGGKGIFNITTFVQKNKEATFFIIQESRKELSLSHLVKDLGRNEKPDSVSLKTKKDKNKYTRISVTCWRKIMYTKLDVDENWCRPKSDKKKKGKYSMRVQTLI